MATLQWRKGRVGWVLPHVAASSGREIPAVAWNAVSMEKNAPRSNPGAAGGT